MTETHLRDGQAGGEQADRRRPGGLLDLADRHRYLLLSAALLALMVSQTLNQQWSTDFWEHSAVVRELITHLLHPRHPLLPVDATHPYFSPYTVAVAALGRLLGMGPIGALSVAALLNLVLLLVALRLLVIRLIDNPLAPFYALLFTVVLWGASTWRWSGFLNLNSMGFVLPYPSMFATAVALLSLWALDVFLTGRRLAWLLGATAGGAVVLLTHPITAVAVGIGAAALVVSRIDGRPWRLLLQLLAAGVVALLLVVAWPYYSLFDLVSQSSIYTSSHHVMYQGVPQRIFPALLALPLIVQRLWVNRRDALGLMLVGCAAVYLWGGLSGNVTYGRILAFVVLVLHITLGGWFAGLEQKVRRGAARPAVARSAYAGLAVLLLVGLVGGGPGLLRTIPTALLPDSLRSDSRLGKVSDRYGFLGGCTDQYDAILTDLGFSSVAVPTFGGKVVATGYPIPFVPDTATRIAAVRRFFAADATTAERRAILDRYRVTYLLVDEAQLDLLGVRDGSPDRLGDLVGVRDGLALVAAGAETTGRQSGGCELARSAP